MTNPELLTALGVVITALCAGIAGLASGAAGLFVAIRQAQSQAHKDRVEAKKVVSETDIAERRTDLVIRKDEMDLLRGELARQYAVIEKADVRDNERVAEIEAWRKQLADCQDSDAAVSRKLDAVQDALGVAHRANSDAEALVRFMVMREILFRKTLTDAGLPLPVMKRKGDSELVARINGLIEEMSGGGKSCDSERTDETQA